jgi:methylenetetrahydrofolate reductase (NADPH)
MEQDIDFLKHKLDQGADFAVTQLFFDNRLYFDFVDKARERGVTKPIVPGVLPITAYSSLQRILSFCDASVPPDFMEALRAADARGGKDAVRPLGMAHAKAQVAELLERGAPGVHLYTLNRAAACLEILDDPAVRAALE